MIKAEQLTGFNPDQLTTWPEAVALAKKINGLRTYEGKLVGDGILPLTSNPATSGVYLPPWANTGGPEPSIGKAKWYCFRFKNGFSGSNCGLVRDEFNRYPNSPGYVIEQLSLEIGT